MEAAPSYSALLRDVVDIAIADQRQQAEILLRHAHHLCDPKRRKCGVSTHGDIQSKVTYKVMSPSVQLVKITPTTDVYGGYIYSQCNYKPT